MANTDFIIPGTGFVLLAPVDTDVPDIAKIDYTKPDTLGAWKWLGHTSRENNVALSADGGDSNVLGSWENPSLRSELAATTWSATVNALEITKETLALALPNGKWDDTKKSHSFGGNAGSTDKALLVVMKDSKNGRAAIHMPNASISIGEAPSISTDGFFEIQLKATAQGSPKSGTTLEFFTPRAEVKSAPGESH